MDLSSQPVDFVPSSPVNSMSLAFLYGFIRGITAVVSARFIADPAGRFRSCTPSTSTYGSNGWDDGGNVGAYIFFSTVADLAISVYAEEQFLQGLRMPNFVPSSPVLQTFLSVQMASFGVSLMWSVLSRVRVISDPAGRSPLPRRGIFLGADESVFRVYLSALQKQVA